MWAIQRDHLISFPDDVVLPTGSTRIELPADYFTSRHIYEIRGGAIVKRSDKEIQVLQKKRVPQLTDAEIHRLRAAIKSGKL
jgi:hypothetical protein